MKPSGYDIAGLRCLCPSNVLALAFVITLWLCAGDALSQQFKFKNYPRTGELGDYVRFIAQDSMGFMWFVHEYSVSRFDGHTFKKYLHIPGDTSTNIGAGRMEWPAVSPTGELWINNNALDWSSGYIVRHNWKTDGFENFQPGSETGPLFFDRKEKKVWFGSGVYPPAQTKGLFCLDLENGSMLNYFNNNPDSLQLQNNWIGLIADHDSLLLISTMNGLWMFNKERKDFYRPNFSTPDSSTIQNYGPVWAPDESNNQWMFSGSTKSLIKISSSYKIIKRIQLPVRPKWHSVIDNDGYMWFITANGLMRVDSRDGSYNYITHVKDDPYSLPTNELESVDVDREGNIWVAHGEGVSRLLRSDIRFYFTTIPAGVTQLREVNGELIVVSDFGELWAVPLQLKDSIELKPLNDNTKQHGDGAYRSWKGKRFLWLTIPSNGVVGYPIDTATGRPDPERARIITRALSNKNTITSDSTIAVWEDDKERLWVGTFQGLNIISPVIPYGQPGSVRHFLHDLNDPNSIGGNTVRAILAEDENSVWVITENSVDLFSGDRIEHVLQDRERITSAYRGKDGTLFIGTLGGLYEGVRKGSKYQFTKSELVQEPISEETAMAEDALGRLWVLLAGRGLICYDRKKNTAVRLDESAGLFPWAQELTSTSKGIMVVNDGKRIAMFDPLTLELSETSMLPFLTKLEVNNKASVVSGHPVTKDDFILPSDITSLEELHLDYLHNNFTIEFSSMEMACPEKNLYQHQLVGYDDGWIQSDFTNRRASYTNLTPGRYQFKVRASSYQGVWSDKVRNLEIVILPPPWRTWWAYTVYVIFIGALLAWSRRSIVQRERLKSNLSLEHIELEKAKEVDKVKTSFFTNISHEFRTPLTLIKGPVETLLDRFKDDPDIAQRLKLVQRNSEVLLRLINQLLDLAKLESGTMKIEKTNSDINSFIRAIAGSFESLARHKNVTLSVEIPSDRNQVIFDKDKLETILINLINNAIKFTPSGGKVHVQAACSNKSLSIIVLDTGIGIPVEHQQKVFERFHQVSEAHKEIGTGIGLSLVKELTQLLEGTITLSSEPGRGTTFTIQIPVEAGTETPGTVVELAEPLANSNGYSNNQFQAQPSHNGAPELPHVLVVEDNNDLRAFIIDSLGEEFCFLEADNGRTGLEIATTDIPDLIISDVMMPEMDGITMAGKIKTDQRSSHIPLILLTAKSTEDSKLQGLKSGADDYLTKPFNREELLLKVRNSISRQIKLREKLRAEVMGSAPTVAVMSEDERFLIRVKETILERLSDEQLSVESLAEDIGISRVHLYRKVSGLTGLSVNELIRKLRLQRAAQLLSHNWGPVSQVAYEVGYSNLSYFSKMFKEEFGTLPSEYEEKSI